MEKDNRNVIWLTAAALIAGLVAGYFIGNAQGTRASEARLTPLVNLAFPPPPDELYALTGTITEIYGAAIALEVDDPADYLPRPDGSPKTKQTRIARISSATIISAIDFGTLDRGGQPTRTPLAFADLQTGDFVTVTSNANIRDAHEFDAAVVEHLVH